jgi:hypothetical protein
MKEYEKKEKFEDEENGGLRFREVMVMFEPWFFVQGSCLVVEGNQVMCIPASATNAGK